MICFKSKGTRKLARPLDAAPAAEAVSSFAELPLVQIDSELIVSAIHRSRNCTKRVSDKLMSWRIIGGIEWD